MDVRLEPGKYVVAVSGGVDSVVLLRLLQGRPELRLHVAHFDHGMRPDSAADRQFVEQLARRYGVPFTYEEGRLGAGASEGQARAARYKFLRAVRGQTNARAIITAHHQDDVLETAILNLLRGTGRRGLTSLQETDEIKRPLLGVPKAEIITYANQQTLSWREDTTNHDERYTRNYIRHRLLARFDAGARQRLLALIARQQQCNRELEALIAELLALHGGKEGMDRRWFTRLTHAESREVLATWLRAQGLREFDRRGIERLVAGVKVHRPGTQLDVPGGARLHITTGHLALQGRER